MKNRNIFIMLVSLALILTSAWTLADATIAEKTLYVQSARAKLLESPDFKSRVVASADKGTVVQVTRQTGNWVQVRFDDQVGWVSRLVLSDTPPVKKNSVLKGKAGEMQHKARRRASSTATAAATRGLRDDNRTRASDSTMSDFNALKQVESNQADKEAVEQFTRQKQPEPEQ